MNTRLNIAAASLFLGLTMSQAIAAPSTGDDDYQTNADTVLNIAAPGLLANDGGVGTFVKSVKYQATVAVGSQFSTVNGAKVTVNSNGSLTYDPNGSFTALKQGEAFKDLIPSESRTFSYVPRDFFGSGVAGDVVVEVVGVNDPPTAINVQSSNEPESASAISFGDLTAVDPDGSVHTFSLVAGVGGTDNSLFRVAGIKLESQPAGLDFETKSSYSVRVKVEDDLGAALEQILNITITDTNDNAPTITSAASITVNENETATLTVTSTDSDTVGSAASYSIIGGVDQALFDLGGADGVLTFKVAKDFEVPSDSNSDNVYEVQVSVSDGANTTGQVIAVTVQGVNEAPTASDNAKTISEDASYQFLATDFGFSDVDGHSLSFVRIATLPAKGDLVLTGSGKINTTNTTVNLADIPNLSFVPDADDEAAPYASFDFKLGDSSGDESLTSNQFSFSVNAVADTPALTANSAVTFNEDTDSPSLNIATSLTDASNETLSVSVDNVPTGVTLSDGVNSVVSSGTSIDVTTWSFSNIKLSPVGNDDSDFVVTIRATSTEANGADTATKSVDVAVAVTAVADLPSVNVSPASGSEDTAISLTISGALTDLDGSEDLLYTISNVPAGSVLNRGIDAGGGVWNLLASLISGLTIIPPLHSATDFVLAVKTTATEKNGGDIAVSAISNLSVTLTGIADSPILAVTNSITVNEDELTSALGVSATVAGGSEEALSLFVENAPVGSTLTDGTNTAVSTGSAIDVSAWAQASIKLQPPLHSDADFAITLRATITEASGGDTADVTRTSNIQVTAVADVPTLNVTSGASGNEDSSISLTIGSVLTDTDGSESVSYTLSNIPNGATLNNGVDAGGGVWNLSAADVGGLSFTPVPNDDADPVISVVAVAADNDASTAQSAVSTITVNVSAIADVPNVTVVTPVTKAEDANPFPLTIGGSLADADGSEVLSYEISGVINAATLSAGTNSGGGVWVLTQAEAESGLTLTMAEHDATDFQIDVDAIATETNGASSIHSSVGTGRINIVITDVADAPSLTINTLASGNEDTAIALSIAAALLDVDGSESLTVELTGQPVGSSFSAGTDLGGGKWGVALGALSGLTITPAPNNNDDFSLTTTAKVIEASGGSTAQTSKVISVQVQAVNDAPSVLNQTFNVDENAANGTVVGTVVVSDIEPVGGESGQTLSYNLEGTAFSVSSAGVVSVLDDAQLDYESVTQLNFNLVVSDNGLPVKQDSATLTINLNPLNDNKPTANVDEITVAEGASISFNVLSNDTDADIPAQGITVSEVQGDPSLVGVAVDLESAGVVVGTMTLNADGSGLFVASTDALVEQFSATSNYSIVDSSGLAADATAAVNFTISPVNDNPPERTPSGFALQTSGIVFSEDQFTSNTSVTSISLGALFSDLDIDADALLDLNTGDDNDGIIYSVQNSNAGLVSAVLQGDKLTFESAINAHGSALIVLMATDTAAPAANVTTATITFTLTVISVNDAPVYVNGSYNNITLAEDSSDVVIDLANAFVDQDLLDGNASDELLIYRISIRDDANEFVLTEVINDAGLNIVSDTLDGDVRVLEVETTDASITLDVNDDAHGVLNITVTATDLGRPPGLPNAAVPLSDAASFSVTITALGDDQPIANDDHYSSLLELVIAEDSADLVFAVTDNDYHGDTPLQVISVGKTIVDALGVSQSWRTTSRLADPNNTGDLAIEINGEVSCGHNDCVTGQTADTTVDGDGLSPDDIVYRPRQNFNGEDSFTYCVQDSSPSGEDAFTPPADPRCATVTINVTPVNDAPEVDQVIVMTMDQASDLVVSAEDGLRNFVRDLDNTHIDGLGCDPMSPDCAPGVLDPQADTLHFYFTSAVTAHGQLLAPFSSDGAFNYRPDPNYFGDDEITFEVCDRPTPGTAGNCSPGILSIQIEAILGAPVGSTADVVQFDYQLANIPLELPVGPEPNVLIVNDDSGSMDWDIMVDGTNSLYYFSSGNYINYVNKATAGSSTYVAPKESDAPNEGLWRVRTASYNSVYYNPEVRYRPWPGLDTNDNVFPNSPPTAARHNPLSSSQRTNLTLPISYTGRAYVNIPRTCEYVCRRFRRGRCTSYRYVCSGGSGFQQISVSNFYIPKYYNWIDRDGDGEVDATPSPATNPSTAEGELIEIRSGRNYPRTASRTDCTSNESYCTYTEELQNFANWFTYSRNREFTAKSALGTVVANSENIRVGYAKLNSSSNTRRVEPMNTSSQTGAKANLLDAIYQTNSSGGTPLRRALRNAGRYFGCDQYDSFNSSSNTSPGNSRCPILPSPDGNCQQNFVLLLTDGTWNGSSPGSFIGNADSNNNSNFDGGAFAGSSSQTLADVAMYYYEHDLHSGLSDEVPTSARDRAHASSTAFRSNSDQLMHQHMSTYTVGFGVTGNVSANPTQFNVGFNWGNPFSSGRTKIDDLRHAAYNGRGEYLDASNGADLSERLIEAFDEFAQSSGAASAVSFNSQEIKQDTLIFRAFYNTKINTGDLIAQKFDGNGLVGDPVWSSSKKMDEVTANNREILTYDADLSRGVPFRPASLNATQRVPFISDPFASSTAQNNEVINKVNYLRGDAANERPLGVFRERPTTKGRLGDIVHSTPVFVGAPNRLSRNAPPFPTGDDAYSKFSLDNQDRTEIIYVESNDGMAHGFRASDGSEVFAYVPNNLMTGTFSRNISNLLDFQYTHKFFVDLTPAINDVFIDTDGDSSKEWTTVLVGGQGAGAKAYFGLNISTPTKLTESDADDVVLWEFTDEDDTYPTDSGGSALTNLDGSQRQDLQSPAKPVKDLGYAFSVPTLAMSNAKDGSGPSAENEWIVLFGNGYNSTSGIAKLFTLFIDRGIDGQWCHPDMKYNVTLSGSLPADCIGKQDFYKIDTGFGVNNGFPNGLGTPRAIDADGNGTVDYAYAGDVLGNFYRFDLTSSNPSEWHATKIFEATYTDAGNNVTRQPITTQPVVTLRQDNPDDGFLILFATGSYVTTPDGVSRDIQSIYGIVDRLGPGLIPKTKLIGQAFENVLISGVGNVRTLTENVVDYSDPDVRGWYINLDAVPASGGTSVEFPGERAVRNFQLRGGLAFVNSIVPRTANSCVDVAGGFALAFCPETGSVSCLQQGGIFDLNNDGIFDESDAVPKDPNEDETVDEDGDGDVDADDAEIRRRRRVVVATRFEDAVPTDSSFIESKRITQLSDKSLDVTETNTRKGPNTGRLSWKQINVID